MSGLWKLDTKDLLRGLIVSVLSAVLTTLAQVVGSSFDWKQVLFVAIASGLSYLAKNLATDDSGRVLGKV